MFKYLKSVLVLFLFVSNLKSQENFSNLGLPQFSYKVFSFKDSNFTRVDVFLKIQNSSMKFLKMGNVFTASYKLNISISDTNNEMIDEHILNDSILVEKFSETKNDSLYKSQKKSFYLKNGKYNFTFSLTDNESKKTLDKVEEFQIADYENKTFEISDLLFFDSTQNFPTLNVPIKIYKNSKGIFELYNFLNYDSTNFILKFLDENETLVLSETLFQKIDYEKNNILINFDSMILKNGNFKFQIQAFTKNNFSSIKENFISINFFENENLIIENLDNAISQLIYIVSSEFLDSLKNITSYEEKEKKFKNFWKSKDPSLTTKKNELMEEYYKRVEHANKNFGQYIEGWKTDMGMIYITFGKPDNIEKHPFDFDKKAHEVWFYYSVNKEFRFVDETGFGNYRLVTSLWELNKR